MIFKHVCTKGNKYLARIEYDDVGDKWATTTKAVHDWAKRSFKEGDTVDVQYNIKNGQYFVTRISAPGQGLKVASTPVETSKPTCEDCGVELKDRKYKKCYICNKTGKGESKQEKPTCADCGKELKDDKYEKCYTCNQKNPVKKTSGGYIKSPEVQESIKRQAIGHMTSRSLISLQGHIDVNNIQEIAESIYKMYVKLVG